LIVFRDVMEKPWRAGSVYVRSEDSGERWENSSMATGSILPFVKRAQREGAQRYSDNDTGVQYPAGTCPHCGGLLLPGENAEECSSAPREVNQLSRSTSRPSCVVVAAR
jgi:hypothetical protein